MSEEIVERSEEVQAPETESFGGEQTPQSEQTSINPAWQPFLDELPDAYHAVATKHLSGYDRGVQQKFQAYAPFKDFVEQSVDPQELQAAWILGQQLNSNPQQVYERLGQALIAQGYTPQQAQQAVQAAVEEENATDEDDVYHDPKVAELQAQQDQIIRLLREKEQAELSARVERETFASIDLFQSNHNLPKWEMAEVLNRAMARQDLSIEKAYEDWQALRANLARGGGQNAPRVLSGSGGMATTPQKAYADLSASEQRADAIAALRALNS